MVTAPTRFPRQVFDRGEEPDARFTLANERTFLAWIRTSLALLAGGVALHVLGPAAHPQRPPAPARSHPWIFPTDGPAATVRPPRIP